MCSRQNTWQSHALHYEGKNGALHPERDRDHHLKERVHLQVVLGQGRGIPHSQGVPSRELNAISHSPGGLRAPRDDIEFHQVGSLWGCIFAMRLDVSSLYGLVVYGVCAFFILKDVPVRRGKSSSSSS